MKAGASVSNLKLIPYHGEMPPVFISYAHRDMDTVYSIINSLIANGILFINACVRRYSRVLFLAEQVIGQLNGTVPEINPVTITKPITSEEFIINRTEATSKLKRS